MYLNIANTLQCSECFTSLLNLVSVGSEAGVVLKASNQFLPDWRDYAILCIISSFFSPSHVHKWFRKFTEPIFSNATFAEILQATFQVFFVNWVLDSMVS